MNNPTQAQRDIVWRIRNDFYLGNTEAAKLIAQLVQEAVKAEREHFEKVINKTITDIEEPVRYALEYLSKSYSPEMLKEYEERLK